MSLVKRKRGVKKGKTSNQENILSNYQEDTNRENGREIERRRKRKNRRMQKNKEGRTGVI